MARYGMPWQGSKSRIAEWVIGLLPPSHTLVDLFAGGGAITHCALLSGKWERIIANDMTDSMMVFMDAAHGEFDGYATVATREDFMTSEDTALQILYSFGNNRSEYLWSDELESFKVPAARMLTAPSLHERRLAYRDFCRKFLEFVNEGADGSMRLQPLERLQNMQNLEALERLEALQGDYRLVAIPDGATVYADPPYRDTDITAYGEFDFDAFDAWLNGVDFPVFVSEYTPPRGCIELASIEHTSSMPASCNVKTTERIFVQKRFADVVQVGEPTLF